MQLSGLVWDSERLHAALFFAGHIPQHAVAETDISISTWLMMCRRAQSQQEAGGPDRADGCAQHHVPDTRA